MRTCSKWSLAASAALALALTLSCSDDKDDDKSSGGGKAEYGSPVTYEGETYKTVVIGTQTWFAKNLNYNAEGSKCHSDKEANCTKYGRLYDWETANTVCPSGWHLPSNDDWQTLASYIESDNGCSKCDAKHLKATSGWDEGSGFDSYSFTALPGGSGYISSFSAVGEVGNWWSSSESDGNSFGDLAYIRRININDYSFFDQYARKEHFYSVRCIKD